MRWTNSRSRSLSGGAKFPIMISAVARLSVIGQSPAPRLDGYQRFSSQENAIKAGCDAEFPSSPATARGRTRRQPNFWRTNGDVQGWKDGNTFTWNQGRKTLTEWQFLAGLEFWFSNKEGRQHDTRTARHC